MEQGRMREFVVLQAAEECGPANFLGWEHLQEEMCRTPAVERATH